jgi:hypothetical protein
MANYRRFRQVHDLATSKVASAAQGYVELFGRSVPIADSPIHAPLSKVPCCWYSYCIEHRTSDNKWKQEDSGESVAHFLLVDDTGQCVISPDGAEIMDARYRSWTEGARRFTEELLLPGEPLYAIGEFRTMSTVLDQDENSDVGALLGDWKKDQPSLLARFDHDRSGALDLKEWEQARLEARREIRKQHTEVRTGDGMHIMRKPTDGRVFILAAEIPERIGRRFAWWSWVHLAFFFAAGIGSYYLFR